MPVVPSNALQEPKSPLAEAATPTNLLMAAATMNELGRLQQPEPKVTNKKGRRASVR